MLLKAYWSSALGRLCSGGSSNLQHRVPWGSPKKAPATPSHDDANLQRLPKIYLHIFNGTLSCRNGADDGPGRGHSRPWDGDDDLAAICNMIRRGCGWRKSQRLTA
jgi:hypothetical protein